MRRPEFIKLLGTMEAAMGSQQPRVLRDECVGMLETVSTALKHDAFGAFRQALRKSVMSRDGT
jgi:hypothetical protein